MELFASGAAILAARLSGDVDDMKKYVVLLDVTPRSLGIRVQKNATIGATLSRIAVYQGEGVKVKDNVLFGEFFFNSLVLGTKGLEDVGPAMIYVQGPAPFVGAFAAPVYYSHPDPNVKDWKAKEFVSGLRWTKTKKKEMIT
ncbi:heat shock cognate 70 kDa protein-like protein [Tanacetum coccineum]|uniref:Heat shock cognate 70 kDa protein-like protein n=1 Tax=Tanacetum coccineum TaxID=301880 RepID=A0ABQ5IXM0_9ASTR